MGVPSFYRWLVVKYPKIKQKAIEVPDGSATEPNPNGIEFDNLYLDMNCIIHRCFHPEDELFAPETYDDVFQSVFEYIDRIFNIVRPQKLLYMSVDGVAPRAKMNQQRAQKFRPARSVKIAELEDLLSVEYQRTIKLDLIPKEKHEVSDTNVISPGTIFMERLSKALEYYIRLRLNSNPAWMKIKVILSDANVPGEGEHKIMSFIRSQQNSNGYNPNLRHCLYGLDADLIMLALTTHELYFYILREDVSGQNQSTVLTDFGQGLSTNLHEAIKSREWYKVLIQENKKATPTKKPFELINICILREYLELDMKLEEFNVEMDRIVDDFIFMCIFMGNDFLPNLPSLEAHESALDLLMEVYKRTLKKTGGYLIDTAKIKDKKHAYIEISRVKKFILDVGTYEDKIFLKRNNIKEKNLRMFSQELSGGDMGSTTCFDDWEDSTRVVGDNCSLSSSGSTANNELAVINNTSELKIRLKDSLKQKQDTYQSKTFQDKIRLGYPGWKERYYKEKFCAKDSNEIGRTQKIVVEKYMEGLCWVLQYYFVGVCSWTWYYPYHYGPFASDLKKLKCANIKFNIGQPFKPFDQLMAVLPPQSSDELPSAYAELMKCKDSKISKFYPEGDIEIDMDGKRFTWKGVIKLPSINEDLLLESTKMLESQLQIDEIERNSLRKDIIFIRNDSALGLKLAPTSDDFKIPVDFASCEISGVLCNRKELEDGGIFLSPIQCMDDIRDNIVISAQYLSPVVGGVPVLRLLENVEVPDKTITANDVPRRELWHKSSSRQTTTKSDHYRKDVASSGHSRDTWRCAGSDRSGSTGRGWRNLKAKWDELSVYLPPTSDPKFLQERIEQERVYTYLAGLDPSFEPIWAQILLASELPSYSSIVATVQTEESRRKEMNFEPSIENQAFLAHHHQNPNPNSREERRGANSTAKCDNCKKEGHIRDQCWFLYPHLRPKRKGEKGGGEIASSREGERGRSQGEKKGLTGSAFYTGSQPATGSAFFAGSELASASVNTGPEYFSSSRPTTLSSPTR